MTASPHSAAGSPTGSVPTHVYVSSFEHIAWLPGTHACPLSSCQPSCPSSSLLPSLLPYLSPADAPAEMPDQAIRAFPGDVSRTQRQPRAPKGRSQEAPPYVPATCSSPRASPAPGALPGLAGGIVTWTGGSQAGPDDALLPTLSLGFYFCFYFSSYSVLSISASISEVVLCPVPLPLNMCGVPRTLSL